MKVIQTIRKELLPLDSRQSLILLIIIACVFQFILFYTPALAADAVNRSIPPINDETLIISNDTVVKDSKMDSEAAKLVVMSISTSTAIIDSSAPLDSPENQPTSPATSTSIKIVKTSSHVITAYNSEVGQTDGDPCTTANGFNVCNHGQEDTIAANFLKFGTKVQIPELFGDRVFVVRDRMNKKHPARVDVWMKNKKDALKFGKKTAKIQVIE